MRITRLLLKNFIGIKHGLGKYEIVIDLGRMSKKKIVMLIGGNGSGKTTILSQLHPFKDSFDERKVIIIDGKEGLKEIDMEDDGNFYEIKHIYKKAAQSFIKKNGVEMNPNGGVKTFNSFVETEFGLSTDYFKIGKIGSNTENFINFTATERKKYISKFLPQIEDYLEKFDIAKEKFKLANNDIRVVSGDLDKLDDEENIKIRIKAYEGTLKTLESGISDITGEVAVLKSNVKSYSEEIEGIDISEITSDRTTKDARKREIIKNGGKFIVKYNGKKDTDVCESTIEQKTKITNNLSKEISDLNSDKKNMNSLIVSAQNDIAKYELNLKEIESTDDLSTVKTNIGSTYVEISKIQDEIKDDELYSLVNKNIGSISTYLTKFETFRAYITKYFTELKDSSFIGTKMNIELFLQEGFDSTLEAQIKNIREVIQSKSDKLSELNTEKYKKEANLDKVSILEKKPEACQIFTCPFIKDAIQYKDLPEELEKLETKITQIENDIEDYTGKAETITEVKTIYKTFMYHYETLNPRANIVYEYFLNQYGSLLTQFNSDLSSFISNSENISIDINDKIHKINRLSTLNNDLSSLEYKKKFLENTETYKKQINDSIKEKETEIETKTAELETINASLRVKLSKQTSEQEILNDYREYLSGKKEIESLSKLVNDLKKKETNYTTKTALITSEGNKAFTKEAKLGELKNTKRITSNELNEAKSTLANITMLQTKKKQLETDYNFIKTVKECLDPNKGIPLFFIKSYLEKTKDIVNELLDLAFEDDFEINFITNSKEFFIQVRTGTDIKNDIKDASQGEVALTTISISLALIEQAVGEYNILALDEIDGPLDSDNRKNFINILNKQITKLGIEQVFVISHNDAFDTEAMDLILLRENNIELKGDEFMKNKDIIFEV